MKYLLMGLLIIVVVILSPFLTIWSLNTLFPALEIPYSLDTWAAVILLGLAFQGKTFIGK
jgi:cobalamin biosynthesis protein CobD/CbiB